MDGWFGLVLGLMLCGHCLILIVGFLVGCRVDVIGLVVL